MNAIILTIGDEILIGQIVDTNAAWLAQKMNSFGVDVIEKISVGDHEYQILDAISRCIDHADLVIITGGLGPTKDDITKNSLAKYFNSNLIFHQETYDRLIKILTKFGRPITDALREQCFMPDNATILKNDMGTAPGMLFYQGEKMLISLPGVPYEMMSIIENEFVPILKTKLKGQVIIHFNIMTAGEGETMIADRIVPLLNDMPSYIRLAYLPSLGYIRLRLTGRGTDPILINQEINKYAAIVKSALGNLSFGTGEQSLEQYLQQICIEKGIKICTAESCTGGFIAHRITSTAGSSAYFIGSVITYSNEMKIHLLNVKEITLDQHGAVSEETVKEMLMGVLHLTQADVGISISGIAGPDGGSETKPVGTVWIAIGNKDQVKTYKINGTKDRLKNIEYATNVALNKLRLFIEDLN